MNWLFEDSTYVLIIAAIAAGALIFAFLKTGRGLYLTWLAAIALLTLALVLLERYVVTDREKIEDTVYGAASALEQNDVEMVVSYLSSNAEALEREVRMRMRSMQVQQARIADLQIDLGADQSAGQATANILGRLEFKASGVPLSQAVVRARIHLVREGDRWVVQSYELRR